MTQEITRTQYDAYVKEWNNGMFGLDSLPPKSIVRESADSPSAAEEPEPDSESSTWSDFFSRQTETDAQVQTDTETGIVIQPSHECAIKFREGKPQQHKQREPKNDTATIDIDILGRYPKPFDVKPWIQCTVQNCERWLENEELRIRHVAKYHQESKPETKKIIVQQSELEPTITDANDSRLFRRSLRY
jgi:hypothetical protein